MRVYNLLALTDVYGLTRMQIASRLGIERASVCRRVAELRDEGKLIIRRTGLCPITGERAEFLGVIKNEQNYE